jgi:DNA-binding CsgD family transcriptional regulator
VHQTTQSHSCCQGAGRVTAPRWRHLGGNRQVSGCKGLLKQQTTMAKPGPIMGQSDLRPEVAAYSEALPVGGEAMQHGEPDKAAPSELRSDLSEREIEIIDLVARGLTNQEIAAELTISKRTVDNHVSNIFTKTGAKNRVALLNWAMDHGKICRDGFNCCNLQSNSLEAGVQRAEQG